jgi:hypothetical protein
MTCAGLTRRVHMCCTSGAKTGNGPTCLAFEAHPSMPHGYPPFPFLWWVRRGSLEVSSAVCDDVTCIR